MRWYIRRLDSLINPKCPRPYFAGFGPGAIAPREAHWLEERRDVAAYTSARAAFADAREFGANWRELVRVVRVKEAR